MSQSKQFKVVITGEIDVYAFVQIRVLFGRLSMGLVLVCAMALPAVAQDLVLTKTTSSSFVQGGTANYTITARNVGVAATTASFSIADTMPTGLTISSFSAFSPWSCTVPTFALLNCTHAAILAAGATAPAITVSVNIAANAPASITNTATVSGGGDTITNNNSASSTVSVSAAAPDLTITKIAQGSGFQQGGTVTYLLTVTNAGNGPTTGTITMQDIMPTGLTVTSATGTNWTCVTGTTVSCTRTTPLAAGTNSVITLIANIASNAAASITNSASVTTPGESNSGNNGATSVISVTAVAPDLTLTKIAQGSGFQQGGTISYLLTVTNGGNGPTTGTVTMQDIIPTGLTVTSATGTNWTCTTGTTVTCTRTSALAAGTSSAVTLNANIASNAPASITNSAVVATAGESNSGNNGATSIISVTAIAPDLTITKVAQGAPFQQGGTVSYLLTVTNAGNGPTTGTVTMQDIIPTGLTVTSASGANWTCVTGTTVTCTRTSPIAAATSSVITLNANIASNAPASITNSANVAGGGEVVTNNNGGTAIISVSAAAPDLTISKTTPSAFAQGGTASYNLVVNNIGTLVTTGAYTVTDNMPTGLTLASTPTGTGWNCAASTSTVASCTRSAAIPIGASATVITLNVSIAANAPASITNTATVSGGGETLTNNNSSSNTVSVSAVAPDLTITKATSSAFQQGGTAIYTFTVNNMGNGATMAGYTITDNLPTGLTINAIAVSGGWDCGPSTATVLSCSRSTAIPSGASSPVVTLTVNIAANAPASITNTATVSGGGETVTNNNSSSVISTVTPRPSPVLVSVVSQQTHNGVTLSLPIDFLQPVNGAITVEPRSAPGGQLFIFNFDSPISSVDPVAAVVDENNVPIGNSSVFAGGNLNFAAASIVNVPDRRRVTITLTGINGYATARASMGFMVGDVNSSRSINASDISAIKARSGQAVSFSDFMFDVNRTGTISAADIAAAKARLGTTLP